MVHAELTGSGAYFPRKHSRKVANILASRLKKAISKIIGPNTHAPIPDWQILHGALIANKYIDSHFKSNQMGVLCKLDIGKACDHGCGNYDHS